MKAISIGASVEYTEQEEDDRPRKRRISRDSFKARTSTPKQIDDKDGHLIIHHNTIISPHYTIIGLLGQGTFGKVVEAYDKRNDRKCAIKIIKSIQKYANASKLEIRILEELKEKDPQNRHRCIHLEEHFVYKKHVCMVFKLLGSSLFDYFQQVRFQPFSLRQIQSFAGQLISAVSFLHDNGMIHTDLKPENLMLENMETVEVPFSVIETNKNSRTKMRRILKDTTIWLIDFGSTIHEHDYHSSVVSTRHYRAPEIVLGLGWSYPCDLWSIGCILVELYIGNALFQTHENLEHLRMMEIVLGDFPESMIQRVTQLGYFRGNRVDYPTRDTDPKSIAFLESIQSIEALIKPRNEFEDSFLDIIKAMLRYDPEQRITARQALEHSFIRF